MFKNDNGSLSRRELLASLARTGIAAPLALGSIALSAQSPRPPANVKILGPTEVSGSKATLTPNDLTFRGFLRLSAAADSGWFAGGTLALRKVGGETRLLTLGNVTEGNPLLEFAVADQPNLSLSSASVAPLSRNWGSVMGGRTLTGGSGNFYAGGLHWDADRNAVWWSYGDGYVPVQSHPTIGCTILKDSGGTFTSFGPWRTQWTSQRTRGAFCPIPPAFASAYMSGKNVGVMASQASGNVGSPFGAILSGMQLPDPTSTPADVAANSNWTIANQGIVLHDIDHRQARDTKYKTCGWNVQYDCKAGSPILPNPGLFGGALPAAGENDTMSACAWIDLPDKHGLLYFGQLVTTPDGYSAPGDPDGHVHMWYGEPTRSDGYPSQVCCHYQDDPWWGATGPGAHYRVPMGWIYNPNDLVASAQGKADLWSRTPASTFQWKNYVPAINSRYAAGMWAGAAFDPATRRLYALLRGHDFLTLPPHARPVVLVFDVK